MTQKIEIGTRFGKMLVVAEAPKRGPNKEWLCRCDCGSEKPVRADHLRQGRVVSCAKGECHPRHKHGMHGTRTYNAWEDMKGRCRPTAKAREFYHDKGITVCDRWANSFEAFYEDMGECPDGYTLERKDNAKGYSPDNCMWATWSQNIRNRDCSRPRLSKSPYRNVFPNGKNWAYRFTENYEQTRVYGFKTAEDAARAYNKVAAKKGFPLIQINEGQ